MSKMSSNLSAKEKHPHEHCSFKIVWNCFINPRYPLEGDKHVIKIIQQGLFHTTSLRFFQIREDT